MKPSTKKDLVTAALTACILGLVTCPLPYIAFGVLSQYPRAFSLILLPPFLVGSVFLFWRYLTQTPITFNRIALLIAEVLSWGAVAVFLFFISGFLTWLKAAHSIGLASMFFLLMSLICLPLVIWRDTALQARISRLPQAVSTAALLVLLAGAGMATAAYFLVPEHLI